MRMPIETKNEGYLSWLDLTADDADRISDFYAGVLGWRIDKQNLGGNIAMTLPETGEIIAGICRRSASNTGLPPAWLPYFQVVDLQAAISECLRQGGSLHGDIRCEGGVRYAVIRDPSGAFAGICCTADAFD